VELLEVLKYKENTMNKVLFLAACAPCMLFGNDVVVTEKKNPSDQLIEFIVMEQQHKQDWLDHKKESFDAKIEMLKRHKDRLFALKKQNTQELAAGVDIQKFFGEKLDEWIKLHEQQNTEWKELCATQYKKGGEIAQQHKEQLDEFKESISSSDKSAEKSMHKESNEGIDENAE
jgi:hypothetical protein